MTTTWKSILPVLIIVGVTILGLFLVKKAGFYLPRSSQTSLEMQIGTQIPDVALTRFGGGSVPLSEISAKILLLNFWATWCDACMEEFPALIKLREWYHSQGFEFIPINLDENPTLILPRVIQKFKITFPLYFDADGKISELFDVHAIPLSVIIDKNRHILSIISGEANWTGDDFRSKIEKWLNQ